MLTPQQLIDLPGYGNAEKELRKAGMWEDHEEFERRMRRIVEAAMIKVFEHFEQLKINPL